MQTYYITEANTMNPDQTALIWVHIVWNKGYQSILYDIKTTKVHEQKRVQTTIHLSAYFNSCLLVSSAASLCKQFGPRSGPTKCRTWFRSTLFDTDDTLKEFFEKDDFEKNQQTTKKNVKLLSMQRVKHTNCKVNLTFIVGDWTHAI